MGQKNMQTIFVKDGKIYKVFSIKAADRFNVAMVAIFIIGTILMMGTIGGLFEYGFTDSGKLNGFGQVFFVGLALWVLGLVGQCWMIFVHDTYLRIRIPAKGVPFKLTPKKDLMV